MPSISLKEFACAGISLRTGTQIITWTVLFLCIAALQEINYYYSITKKAKLTESPLTIIILDVIYGIIASLVGLYGAYHGKRMWIKQFFIYLMSQFGFLAISIWIYYIYIYPSQPPNPRKTRYEILTTIWMGICIGGLLTYAISIVYSYYKELRSVNDDRQYLVPEEPADFPATNVDRYLSGIDAMSSVSTMPSYFTTNEMPKNPRYVNTFCPPAIPEEQQKSIPEVIQKLDQERLLD